MKRALISETPEMVGKEVRLCGWVNVRRDHGKLIFIDLRDRSGIIQAVVIPDKVEAYALAKEARSEYAVEIFGLIKERPGSQTKEGEKTGGVEMEVAEMKIISPVEGELPFDVSKKELDVNIQTLLDNRNLSLRNKKVNDIFKVYSQVLKSYAEVMRENDFLEIKTPKIVSAATEGGANFFKIKYFKREAYLAQSPQFYKQAGVGAFERVFEIGSVFRAEPHFTSRHVNEFVGLDAEMGFIESFEDIMSQLEGVFKKIFSDVRENCGDILAEYESEIFVPKTFPKIKLTEAMDILRKEYGKEMEGIDMDPESERLISEWAKKTYNSDFIFLTHYPSSIRPFYAMPSADPQYTESFDLIFKGVEIATGGQRIHNYNQLVANIKKHRLNPDDFKDYLEIFKLGMPPHGGWGLGSERIVQKFLGIKSIKEAILFPRDVKRLTP
ncbi:MAG: nondiscriminating aspartyl-tRNA synthetase [Patescibacteria group bacterium]|nr:nondiscriminating aspartyl-tRNA synthetase [Patescibacteria group bacterium]